MKPRLTLGQRLYSWLRATIGGTPVTEIELAMQTRAHWYESGDAALPLKASVHSEDWRLAVSASARYPTLFIEGREIGTVPEWPPQWTLPGQEPGALDVMMMFVG